MKRKLTLVCFMGFFLRHIIRIPILKQLDYEDLNVKFQDILLKEILKITKKSKHCSGFRISCFQSYCVKVIVSKLYLQNLHDNIFYVLWKFLPHPIIKIIIPKQHCDAILKAYGWISIVWIDLHGNNILNLNTWLHLLLKQILNRIFGHVVRPKTFIPMRFLGL